MKSENQISHAEQYKMLREEIMETTREMFRVEKAGVVAVAGIYTWLLLHKEEIITREVWFIAPGLIFICGLRVMHHVITIRRIGKYLRKIENATFSQKSELPGWENNKLRGPKQDSIEIVVSVIGWLAVFALSIIASCKFSK
jgi:hypothetical protein